MSKWGSLTRLRSRQRRRRRQAAASTRSAPPVCADRFVGLEPLEPRLLLSASITGEVWDDLNGDSVQDGGEPGLDGVTIYLDLDDDGELDGGEPSTVTSGGGMYSVIDVVPDTYVVRQVVPAGYAQTFPVDPGGDLTQQQVLYNGVGGVDGLADPRGLTLSPDGKNVYVVGLTTDSLAVFTRDTSTGDLTYLEIHKDSVAGVDGLEYGINVVVSPDGEHVYSTGRYDHAVAIFDRNPSTGALTYLGLVRDGVGGVDGIGGAAGIDVSEDGNHVYVVGRVDEALAVFERNSTTGMLSYVEMHKEGVGTIDGLRGANGVTVSPDGAYVYAAGPLDSTMFVFSRNATTGALTHIQSLVDDTAGVDGLDYVYYLAVSPDSQHVYAASRDDDAIGVFSRHEGTGMLSFVEMEQDEVGGVTELDGATEVTVSPDGRSVYAAAYIDDSVVVFDRDASTGELTLRQQVKDGVDGVDGLNFIYTLAVSSDGEHVYTGATDDSALAVFDRDPVVPDHHVVTVGPNEIVQDIDFGNFAPHGEIHGVKWEDVNGNGVQDGGEQGLAGWTIFLDQNTNGQLDNGELSVVTNVNGNYSFVDLLSDTYTVAEIQQAGWEQVYPSPVPPASLTNPQYFPLHEYGTGHWYALAGQYSTWHAAEVAAEALGGTLATVTSAAEQQFIEDNFLVPGGYSQILWIGATDEASEGNWTWVTGEPFVYENWEVGEPNNSAGTEHYAAMNWHWSEGQGQPGTWNDVYANGNPLDGGVRALPYYALVEIHSSDNGSHTVNLQPGETVDEVDFGNIHLLGEIHGTKWHDLNGDGLEDPGEPGLADWTIYLDQNQNGQLDTQETSTATDSNGDYVFANVPLSAYTVAEVQQEGWQQSYPYAPDVAHSIVLGPGEILTDLDFGNLHSTGLIGETGQVDLTHVPQTIVLQRSYVNPVVFAQSPSFDGMNPTAVRVMDVQSDRFTMFLQEPSSGNGMHMAEQVSYVVLEAGAWTLPDGRLLEVGTADTDATVGRFVSDQWEPINFQTDFASSPVVLSQIQTVNDHYVELFNGVDLTGWQEVGTWVVENGIVRNEGDGVDGLLYEDILPDDTFIYEIRVRIQGGKRFRSPLDDNSNVYIGNEGSIHQFEIYGNHVTNVNQVGDDTYVHGQWYDLRFEADGVNLELYKDDVLTHTAIRTQTSYFRPRLQSGDPFSPGFIQPAFPR